MEGQWWILKVFYGGGGKMGEGGEEGLYAVIYGDWLSLGIFYGIDATLTLTPQPPPLPHPMFRMSEIWQPYSVYTRQQGPVQGQTQISPTHNLLNK
jgi:hypothetical protein